MGLQREGPFSWRRLLSSARRPRLCARESALRGLTVRHASPYEAIAWEFVVTKNGATPVAATEARATKPANRMAPRRELDNFGVQKLGSGSSRCGGSGDSWGGTSPTVSSSRSAPPKGPHRCPVETVGRQSLPSSPASFHVTWKSGPLMRDRA